MKYSHLNRGRKLTRKARLAARRGDYELASRLYEKAHREEDRFDGVFTYTKLRPIGAGLIESTIRTLVPRPASVRSMIERVILTSIPRRARADYGSSLGTL